jgi:hypothetical protein
VARPTLSLQSVNAPKTHYTGGPVDYEVVVESWAETPSNLVVTLDYGTGKSAVKLSFPGSTTTTAKVVKVADPAGLPSACAAKDYVVTVSGGVPSEIVQNVRVTPNCKFITNVYDEWSMSTKVDTVADDQTKMAYLTNVAFETPPTCTAALPKVKALFVNNSKSSSPSLVFQAKAGDTVKAQSTAAFPIAAHQSKEVVATPIATSTDPMESISVSIVDWTKSLGKDLSMHDITLKTTRNCTLAAVSFTPGPRTR